MTEPTRSTNVQTSAQALLWGGNIINLVALAQRALPQRVRNLIPWQRLRPPTLGTRAIKASLPASLIGLTILVTRRPTSPPNPDPDLDPPAPPLNAAQSANTPGRTADENFREYLRQRRPQATVTTAIPPFSAHTIQMGPTSGDAWKRWAAGRRFWKEQQCEAALDQYTDVLAHTIAGWETPISARHLSKDDERYLFDYQQQGAVNKLWSSVFGSTYDHARIEELRRQEATLAQQRTQDLKRLLHQFALFEETTPYAPLLRDALRLLLNTDSDRISLGTPPILATTRHRMFKELLDLVVEQEGYEQLATEYCAFKQTVTPGTPWPDRPDFLHMHLAQQLAKAFYTIPVMAEEAHATLNHVCHTAHQRTDLFTQELPKDSLPDSLQYERQMIGNATEPLSAIVTEPRKLAAKTGNDAFNPGSQQNVSERMWTETYRNAKSEITQRTVQLRVGSPTIGTRAVTGAFLLMLDALATDRQRLLYATLQNSRAGTDEAPRVQLLKELADHPRRRQSVVVMNFPMDGSFYHRRSGPMPLEAFKEELSTMLTRRSFDAQEREQVDTRDPAPAFYVPIAQLNELYGGPFPWDRVVNEVLHDVQAQYFSQKESDLPLSRTEQRAFLLITYAKLAKKLRPLLGIDFAIEGCKDDQDRGATVKLIHALDNLILKERQDSLNDLLQLRLLYHRAAWFNKSQAVLEHGRADYAEETARIMLASPTARELLPSGIDESTLDEMVFSARADV